MEGLKESIRQRIGSYWAEIKLQSLYEPPPHAWSLTNLESGNEMPESIQFRTERTNVCNQSGCNIMNVDFAQAFGAWLSASTTQSSRLSSY